MCRRITCSVCGKPGWAGCGAHVESVLGDVPRDKRCQCKASAQPKSRGFLASLFGGDDKG